MNTQYSQSGANLSPQEAGLSQKDTSQAKTIQGDTSQGDANQRSADAAHAELGYAGNISPQVAWQWWQAGDAVLIDVRTDAEREWVGFVPGAVLLPFKQWPGMALNPDFDAGLQAAASSGQKLLLLCRSGVRSIAAAKRAAALDIAAYNILEGFEGDADTNGQRGTLGGWRVHGLPWQQN